MSENLRKCLIELQSVAKLREGKKRSTELKKLSQKKCIYLALREIAMNVVNRNIKIPKSKYKTFTKHKNIIKRLASGNGKKHLKKRMIMQSGGFISAVLPLLLPLVSAVATPLINAAFKKSNDHAH